MDGKPHIIQKVHGELTVSSKDRHREKSERLRQAIQDAIQNLEPVLDELTGESLYRIDSMSVELTLQSTDFDRLEEHLTKAVKAKVSEMIKAQPSDVDEISKKMSEHISLEESHREILSFFLKTGRLPWWVEPVEFADVEDWAEGLSAKDWISFLKPLLNKQSAVVGRLVAQFSDSLVESLIRKLVAEEFRDDQIIRLKGEILQFSRSFELAGAITRQIKAILQSNIIESVLFKRGREQITDKLLISAINIIDRSTAHKPGYQTISENLNHWFRKSENPNADLWINRLNKISVDRDRIVDRAEPDLIIQEETEEQRSTNLSRSNEEEGLRAIHAGVVILHSFLESLFKNLGYVENGEFRNEAARERAVCMVYYLATGEEEFPEYELQVSKFLCGWPTDLTVNRFLTLTEPEKEECKSVLLSCIEHWEALKNTSIDGLRKNFLQREGILKREEFGWSLYIEQQTMDLLLEKLPWNLSIIKMKWMDEMLTVHWH